MMIADIAAIAFMSMSTIRGVMFVQGGLMHMLAGAWTFGSIVTTFRAMSGSGEMCISVAVITTLGVFGVALPTSFVRLTLEMWATVATVIHGVILLRSQPATGMFAPGEQTTMEGGAWTCRFLALMPDAVETI